jgi:hypothetical protein
MRQHQRSLQKAQRELEREKSKLEAQEKKTMADIKKNAKAGNMVSKDTEPLLRSGSRAVLKPSSIQPELDNFRRRCPHPTPQLTLRTHARSWPRTLSEHVVTFKSSLRCEYNSRQSRYGCRR